MSAERPGVRRVTAMLAELIVKGLIGDDRDVVVYRVTSDGLALQMKDPQTALRVARAVLPWPVRYEADDGEKSRHHRWIGHRDGVHVEVVGLGALEDDDPLDPLDAADEDDYLHRVIALGLVVGDD